jgi:nucleoside-diphosphate-sugar epimerase
MRVFVTGAGGFVGRRLMRRLREAGHEAIGADRDVDVTDEHQLYAALSRHAPEAVVHLAAMSSVAASWQEPLHCYRVNFLGTRTLLNVVESLVPSARVLLIGSADQYAPGAPQSPPLSESSPLRPRSPYARTKAAAEFLGHRARMQGLDTVCVRAFNHTAAGQGDAFVASSFARQVAAIRAGRQDPVMHVGNLASVRDFLHVEDVLSAYLALLEPDVPADVYNVASGEATSIGDLLDRLISMAEIHPRVEQDPARFRPTDWLVGDASHLRAATGWTPTRTLDSTLRELFDDWLARDAS